MSDPLTTKASQGSNAQLSPSSGTEEPEEDRDCGDELSSDSEPEISDSSTPVKNPKKGERVPEEEDYWDELRKSLRANRNKTKEEAEPRNMITGTYFMPYLGEPDPTYFMKFIGKGKPDNKEYKKDQAHDSFKTKYTPDAFFIRFAVDVACHLQKYQQTGGLSSSQYAAMISPYFSEEAWDAMSKSPPAEMLSTYAMTHYSWRQRRHDYRQRSHLPSNYQYGYHRERFDNIYNSYRRDPENRLSLALYQAPLEVAEGILRDHHEVFNENGFAVDLGNRDPVLIIQKAMSRDTGTSKVNPLDSLRGYGDPPKGGSPAKRTRESTEAHQRPSKRKRSIQPGYVVPDCSPGKWTNGEAKQE